MRFEFWTYPIRQNAQPNLHNQFAEINGSLNIKKGYFFMKKR